MEQRFRALERRLGGKTIEVEIPKEELAKLRQKNRPCSHARRWRTICRESDRTGARRLAVTGA